eukprot:4134932-Amphidinium_carterae.2
MRLRAASGVEDRVGRKSWKETSSRLCGPNLLQQFSTGHGLVQNLATESGRSHGIYARCVPPISIIGFGPYGGNGGGRSSCACHHWQSRPSEEEGVKAVALEGDLRQTQQSCTTSAKVHQHPVLAQQESKYPHCWLGPLGKQLQPLSHQ